MGKRSDKQSVLITKSIVDMGREIKMAIGNTIIDFNRANIITLAIMWKASDDKLQYLESQLNSEDISNPLRKVIIEQSIRTNLIEFTRPASEALYRFETEVGKLGSIVMNKEVFDFDAFLPRVYKIFFREQASQYPQKEKDIKLKMKDFESLMRRTHNEMVAGLKNEYLKKGLIAS